MKIKTVVEMIEDYGNFKQGKIYVIPMSLYLKIKKKCKLVWRTK
jgi:hypothetical protein